MKLGKIIAAILVIAGIALVFTFTLKNLLNGMDDGTREAQEAMIPSANQAAETVESTPSENIAESADEVPTEASAEASTEATEELPELNGFDPSLPYFDTMGFGMKPIDKEDYIVESTDDIAAFWDNGKNNYVAFKSFMIQKAYKNTRDMECEYFVDLQFKDGTSLKGMRCNDITELTEGRRFRYGYVMDDSTQANGENVMYLYLVQE